MACVPPRAGLDAPQEPSIIQGVQSTLYLQKQWKMRQALYGSCKSRPQVWHVRGTASQAVIVDDTEASQKKTTRWRRWQAHETMVLITAKQQQELGQLERAEAENGSKRVKKKWEEIEAFCQENGIERTAQQCKDRWDRLMVTYSQIRSWEKTRRPDKLSFWSMKLDERKAEGFLLNLDQETYNALDEVHNHEGRMAVSDVLVENDVEDKPEIGGVDYSLHKYDAKQHAVDEADLGSGHGQEHMDEVAVGMNALLRYDILQSNEEKQNGGLPSDNESGEKVQPVSISKSGPYHLEKCEVDVKDVIENPVSLLKGIEGLKSSIMSTYLDNADSIHQNSESRSIQHQFLPADHVDHTEETAQRMDGTNSVFEHSIEHDCNETKTESGQATGTTLGLKKAIPVKSVEWREEIQNKKIMSTLLHASPEKLGDSYKGQLLHANPAKVDDCYKDQHQHLIADSLVHHQKELGVKEDINVTVGYDVENNQSTGLKQDGMMHFARNEKGEEQSKGADWISAAYHETDFSATTDGLEVGVRSDNANFMITLEGRETCKGQKTVSQLISCTQVDALYQYQYQQVAGTSGSFISIHEQGCQHPLEGPMLAKDKYVDKNEKGEKGSKDGSLLCHKRIETGAIDSLNVSVDNTQSNSMKTQRENAENQNKRFESMAAPLKDFVSSIEKAGGSLQKDLHRSPYQQFISAGSLANCKEEVGTKAVLEHDIDSNKKALNTCGDEARASKSSDEKAGTFDSAAAMSVSEELSNSTLYTEKTDVSNQDRKYVINQSQSFQAGDHMEKNAAMTKGMAAVREHSAEEPQNNMDDYDERSPVLEHISEHFEGVMKCKESNVNKELYGYTRLVQEGDTSGTTIGMKDAINDDVENPKAMIEGSVSRTMHSNNSIPCAEKTGHNHQEVELRSIQHEFQHAGSFPYHEGSFKEEEPCVDKNGNPEKLREEGSGGDSDTIAELESVTKDGRGTPVTSQKGSEESQSKKTSSSNTEFDDDVFRYIQAAIGNLVRFVSQAIGKFFRL